MSATLQQFVTHAVVAAAAEGSVHHARAVAALESYVSSLAFADRQAALISARAALESVKLDGAIAKKLFVEIDTQLSALKKTKGSSVPADANESLAEDRTEPFSCDALK